MTSMIATNKYAALTTALVIISLLAAAQTIKPYPEATPSPDSFNSAAHQTCTNFINAYNRGEEKACPFSADCSIISTILISVLRPWRRRSARVGGL